MITLLQLWDPLLKKQDIFLCKFAHLLFVFSLPTFPRILFCSIFDFWIYHFTVFTPFEKKSPPCMVGQQTMQKHLGGTFKRNWAVKFCVCEIAPSFMITDGCSGVREAARLPERPVNCVVLWCRTCLWRIPVCSHKRDSGSLTWTREYSRMSLSWSVLSHRHVYVYDTWF